MRPRKDQRDPDLDAIAARLTDYEVQIDDLDLDRLKRRALARPTSPKGGRTRMKTRLAAATATLALLAGAGGALAVGQTDHHANANGGAASEQYRPGKGCGDKNHQHSKESECKNNGDH